MNDDISVGYSIRQVLNYGIETLDERLAARLLLARQAALDSQSVGKRERRLVGFKLETDQLFPAQIRSLLVAVALAIGAVGTWYWNWLDQIQSVAAIDAELLADELPLSLYSDQGFQAWLDHGLISPSQDSSD